MQNSRKGCAPRRDWEELARKESPEAALHLAVAKDGVAEANIAGSSGGPEGCLPPPPLSLSGSPSQLSTLNLYLPHPGAGSANWEGPSVLTESMPYLPRAYRERQTPTLGSSGGIHILGSGTDSPSQSTLSTARSWREGIPIVLKPHLRAPGQS